MENRWLAGFQELGWVVLDNIEQCTAFLDANFRLGAITPLISLFGQD